MCIIVVEWIQTSAKPTKLMLLKFSYNLYYISVRVNAQEVLRPTFKINQLSKTPHKVIHFSHTGWATFEKRGNVLNPISF